MLFCTPVAAAAGILSDNVTLSERIPALVREFKVRGQGTRTPERRLMEKKKMITKGEPARRGGPPARDPSLRLA
jgi:hypothetical protein